jgi:arsenate reductase (thioredoxin)
MNDRPLNVLFLCTGNSARSILAEAYLNASAKGRFKGYSAGSRPKGTVHPLALLTLEKARIDTAELRSKSWDEFARTDAPRMDFVFTVCDNAANQVCPIWPGQPISAHWGVEDPAATEDLEQRKAFDLAYNQLTRRIQLFISLPLEKLDRIALEKKVREIGRP